MISLVNTGTVAAGSPFGSDNWRSMSAFPIRPAFVTIATQA
jgi:hypothetical protein